MSNISDEKVFDRAVDLIVHQDQMLQNWTTRLVAIEGGLMFAVATLLQWRVNTPALLANNYSIPFIAAETLIAFLGIGAAWLIAKMVEFELEWQRNYVMATKRAEGENPVLYPFEMPRSSGSRTLRLFHWTRWLLTLMWLGLIAVIVFLPQIQVTAPMP